MSIIQKEENSHCPADPATVTGLSLVHRSIGTLSSVSLETTGSTNAAPDRRTFLISEGNILSFITFNLLSIILLFLQWTMDGNKSMSAFI